jgi:diketogulonate reductase-like aldo/keto reductase
MDNAIPNIELNDKHTIPQIGLGVWQVSNEADLQVAFKAAINAGYRHFDTAQAYHNEQMIGRAWKESGLKRNELFITTKIAVENFGAKHTLRSFETSLEKLQTDYVDLILLHFPVTLLRKKSWPVLEKLQREGKAKSIGVSNFTIRHLEEMKEYSGIITAVFLQQPELIEYCHEHGIAVEAYSPLAHAKEMDEPVVQQIAKKHNKSYAQIMLRWCVEKNLIVIPKSVTPSRIKENIDIFDFKLDQDDMTQLTGLERNLRTCWNPTLVP